MTLLGLDVFADLFAVLFPAVLGETFLTGVADDMNATAWRWRWREAWVNLGGWRNDGRSRSGLVLSLAIWPGGFGGCRCGWSDVRGRLQRRAGGGSPGRGGVDEAEQDKERWAGVVLRGERNGKGRAGRQTRVQSCWPARGGFAIKNRA